MNLISKRGRKGFLRLKAMKANAKEKDNGSELINIKVIYTSTK